MADVAVNAAPAVNNVSTWNSSGACNHAYVYYYYYDYASIGEFIECSPLAPHLPLLLLSLLTSLLFYILATTADKYLCPALLYISKALGLSDTVAGVTLVAFGNGAPDIFSALSEVRQSRSSMAFTHMFGSGAFVSILVTGVVMFVVPPFAVDWTSFSRDIVFYLSGSIFTFYVFYRSKVQLMHAIVFVGIYVAYIAVVSAFSSYWGASDDTIDEQALLRNDTSSICSYDSIRSVLTSSIDFAARARNSTAALRSATLPAGNVARGLVPGDSGLLLLEETSSTTFDPGQFMQVDGQGQFIAAELLLHVMPWSWQQFQDMQWYVKMKSVITLPVRLLLSLTVPVIDVDAPKANWCKVLSTVHCFVTPALILCLYGVDYRLSGVPLVAVVLVASAVLGTVTLFTSTHERPPTYQQPLFAVLGLLASTAWIYRTCETLVMIIGAIGTALGISGTVLGLTVLAWGNCIGDLVTDVAIARRGFPGMAISAAFGGTILNMTLGLGIPYLIALTQDEDWTMSLDWSCTVIPVFSGILSFLIIAPLTLYGNGWRSSKLHGFVFIAVYLTMLTTAVGISIAEANGML